MTAAAMTLPRDPAQRRRLWREWTHADAPAAAANPGTVVVRRATKPGDQRPGDDWLPDAIDAPAAVIAGLARAVRESLVGDQLPYGDRARLIARAQRLGLNRFEANLLIAATVHRAGRIARPMNAPERSSLRVGPIVCGLVAVEALLGVGLWCANVR